MQNKAVKIIIGVLLVLTLGYFFVLRPYLEISSKAKEVMASGKELKEAFSKSNINLLNTKLNEFSQRYDEFKQSAESVYWASFIPYVADFRRIVDAGEYLISAGKETVVAITPYADLIGFKKGETSFLEKPAEDRLQTAILTLDKVLVKIDAISEDVEKAEENISAIDPNRYPKQIGKTMVREKISSIKEQFTGIASLFVNAKPLVKNLPAIFGKDKERTYLILFQNDKEKRATGGFLTAYALFKVKDGKMKIERSEDIYSLDNNIPVHPDAPREITTYHKGVNKLYVRDSNISPDFPAALELFNSLYQKSKTKVAYDGVIAVDSKILVDMLEIFGDTEADGVVFSAKKDKRCDCPQVLYKLFDLVDRPVPYFRENRKGILGDLMYALFYKAIGFSPSKYWGTLTQTMYTNLETKHILLYFNDKQIQSSIEKLNFGGRINAYDGDYLHINNVNFAGAKSNMFVAESIVSKTKTDGGKLEREVTVLFRNPHPPSDCNLERGGLCLNAILRNWIRVYVPKGSKLVSFDGSEKKTNTYDELGKTVFEGFLTVTPMGKAQVVVRYTLPDAISDRDYKLLVQKQPGSENQTLEVQMNGKKLYDGVLDVDKEVRGK